MDLSGLHTPSLPLPREGGGAASRRGRPAALEMFWDL